LGHKSRAKADSEKCVSCEEKRVSCESLECTAGRLGAGHRTSIACASKALEEHGGVSVDVRDGREARLYDRVDMPEMENDERDPEEFLDLSPPAREEPARDVRGRDAGQWPNTELGVQLGGRNRTSGPPGRPRSECSEWSSGGAASGRLRRGLVSSRRLSPPRLLCGRVGLLGLGSLIRRSSKPPSSSEEGSSDESPGLLRGPSSKLRRRFFA